MVANKIIYCCAFLLIGKPLFGGQKGQLRLTPAASSASSSSTFSGPNFLSAIQTNGWALGLGITGIAIPLAYWFTKSKKSRRPSQAPRALLPKSIPAITMAQAPVSIGQQGFISNSSETIGTLQRNTTAVATYPQGTRVPQQAEDEKKAQAQSHELSAFERKIKEEIDKQYLQNPTAESVFTGYQQGKALFLKVMQQNNIKLSADEIRHLLWFFYIQAVATKTKNNFFEEGTFRFVGTADQINKLYDALLNALVPYYNRMSSHYAEHSTAPSQPQDWWNFFAWNEYWQNLYNHLFNRHKGLDLDGLPPRDMHTLLFEKLQDNQLYIKPEQHGTNSAPDFINHTKDYLISLAKKKLPENILAFLGDVMTIRPDDAKEFQKERVPTEVQKKAIQLIEQAEKILSEQPTTAIAAQKKVVKEWGIQHIVPKLADYASNAQLEQDDPKLHAEIQVYLQDLMNRYQDWRYRKGNEIVFTIDELIKAAVE